ncbi:branched-chain-amino-acid transaminase [Brevundimonas sp.]|uniref:branched-chain-amino-acid transaminase n=1 Tax=Brevundimonas sp. TaxID=1871086 RepID=UPI003D6D7CDD
MLTKDAAGALPSEETTPTTTAVPGKPQLWFDGAFVDADSPRVALTTHAMHYGSGVFEGIRSYATADGAAVFRLPEHLERMRQGAELLGIEFDVARATEATLAVLRRNGLRDAYIRPLAWCGVGSIGLDVGSQTQHLMVATFPTNVHLGQDAVRLGVSSWRRNPASSLPPLKLCGAYVNSILAKRESRRNGFDEALFTDADGDVVECTGANVFMVRDGRITAVAHRDALPGITRATVIELTGAGSRTVTLDELLDADEVFIVGTAAEVTPIAAINQRIYGAASTGREIADLYQRVVRGEEGRHGAWLTHV